MYQNKREFFDACMHFDWYYQNADDQRVYSDGKNQHYILKQSLISHPEFQEIYSAFEKHYFSGKPWGTEKVPIPKFEDYE